MAKSMVKRRLDAMESFVGTPLLHRDTRGVTPTPAGELFVSKVQQILISIDELKTECRKAAGDSDHRSLRVAYYSDFMFPIVQYICDRYTELYPNDTVIPVFMRFRDAHRYVLEGLCDVAMCTKPPADQAPNLTCTPLYTTPLVAIVATRSSLAHKTVITREDLASHRVVVHPMWCPRDEVVAWSNSGNVTFSVEIDDGNTQSMQSVITDGGIYLYPATDEKLVPYPAVPLEDPIESVSTLVCPADPTPAAIDFARSTVQYLHPYIDAAGRLTKTDWSNRPE